MAERLLCMPWEIIVRKPRKDEEERRAAGSHIRYSSSGTTAKQRKRIRNRLRAKRKKEAQPIIEPMVLILDEDSELNKRFAPPIEMDQMMAVDMTLPEYPPGSGLKIK